MFHEMFCWQKEIVFLRDAEMFVKIFCIHLANRDTGMIYEKQIFNASSTVEDLFFQFCIPYPSNYTVHNCDMYVYV